MAATLVAMLALAGCSSPAGEGTPESTPVATSGSDAFPVTLNTAYGEITVPEKPERIFVHDVGLLELLSILGEKPVAWNAGANDRETLLESLPWIEDIATSEPDKTFYVAGDNALNAEALAALKPDLILTSIWTVDEQLYAQLSQIAPTYAGLEVGKSDSWQDSLRSFALLTGHDPVAAVDGAESELKAAFAAASDRLPGLQGATFQFPTVGRQGDLTLAQWDNSLFERFGLVPGEGQKTEELTSLSWENIERLNADVLFVGASGSISDEAKDEAFAKLQQDPRFSELPAAQNGTVFYLSSAEYFAVNGSTPASIAWWLDQVVPRLEGAALNQAR